MRGANPRKAAGPDQIGAEVWRANVPGLAKRCFALFLKSGLRHQWVAEFAGGDLIPLYKKGDAARPSNYGRFCWSPLWAAFSPEPGGRVWLRHSSWYKPHCNLVDMNK